MKKFLFALINIFDILIFIFLFYYPSYLIIILLLHILFFVLSKSLYNKFDEKIDDLPIYMVLFMPLLGNLILSTYFYSTLYFHKDNEYLSDYEQLISKDDSFNYKEKIDYEKEVRTMSFLDMLSFIDPERKKEILIDSQYNVKINNTKILKKGLSAEDREVQHYSATLLNSRENELTNNISFLREKFNDNEEDKILDQLIEAYKNYLDSGLIEPDSIIIFREEYIDALKQKVKRKKYDLNVLNEIFKNYILVDDLYNATLLNEKIKDEFGEIVDVKINNFNILYKKGMYSELFYELDNLSAKELAENKRLHELKKFFRGEVDKL